MPPDAYDAGGYNVGGYDTVDDGSGPLPIAASAWLTNPALCWVIEHYDGSLPLSLTDDLATTAALNLGPRIFSSRDLRALAFGGGARASHVQYDTLVRQFGRSAFWRLAEFTGATFIAGEVDTGSAMVMNWQGGGALTSTTTLTPGDTAGALQFDGTHYLKMAADDVRLDVGTGSFSMGALFQCSSGNGGTLFGKADNTSLTNGMTLDIGVGQVGRPRCVVHALSVLDSTLALDDNAVHLIGMTLDRTAQSLALFVDGRERSRISTASFGATDINSTKAATIGAFDDGTAILKFTGTMAKVARWSRVLSAEEWVALWRRVVWLTEVSAEARIVSRPRFVQVAPVEGDGVPALGELQVDYANSDGLLTPWLDGEVRGTVGVAHLYDATTGTLVENVFRGELASIQQVGRTVSCSYAELPLAKLSDIVPRARVRPSQVGEDFPTAQDGGAPLTRGWGVCESLPCPNLSYSESEGYRYVVGGGNWAVARVDIDGIAVQDRAEYTLEYRTVIDGVTSTVLRFGTAPLVTSVVTCTARRLPDVDQHVKVEWDWMGGFGEKLAGLRTVPGTSLGFSDLTPAALTSDPVTSTLVYVDPGDLPAVTDDLVVGGLLGAVTLNGTSHYLESGSAPDAMRWQTFTVEGFSYLDPTRTAVMLCSPFQPAVSPDLPPWHVRILSSSAIAIDWRTAQNVSSERSATFTGGADWYSWAVVKTPTRVVFYVNGVAVGTFTNATPIVYGALNQPASSTFVLGRTSQVGQTQWWANELGWMRVSTVERTAREIEQHHFQLWGSPVEALREVIEQELLTPCDAASWSTATATLDGVGGIYAHGLRVDGAISARTAAAEVIGWLARVRDLRLGRNADGVTCTVPSAVTTAVAGFSSGSPYNNVTGEPSRLRPSTGEAVHSLQVFYDRTATGTYQHDITVGVAPVGRDNVPVTLPLIRDFRAADIVAQWLQHRLQQRSQLYALAVGHEGRGVAVGDVVQLTLPAFGTTQLDCEVLSRGLSASFAELTCTPYDAGIFLYDTPSPLPAPPLMRTDRLDVGRNPALEYDSTTRTLRLQLQTVTVVMPTANGSRSDYAFTGAPTAWQAVSDLNVTTSYLTVVGAGLANLFTAPVTPVVPEGWRIGGVRLNAVAILVNPQSGSPTHTLDLLSRVPRLSQTTVHNTMAVTTGNVVYSTVLSTFPNGFPDASTTRPTSRGWVADDFLPGGIEFGVSGLVANGAESIRVSEVSWEVLVRPVEAIPKALGFSKFWIRPTGATAPVDGVDLPAATTPLLETAVQVTAGGYQAWAAVYDVSGRRASKVLGPLAFTVV